MRQKDKKILLNDLYARLPYGVRVDVKGFDFVFNSTLFRIYKNIGFSFEDANAMSHDIDVKPYLFPLSSMSEEQKEDMIKSSCGIGSEKNVFDWYNKNHFDYRGLIEKGLAIDATGKNIY